MSTKKVKKKLYDYFVMLDAIEKLEKVPGFKFRVTLAVNEKILLDKLTVVREKSKPSKEFNNFVNEENKLKDEFIKSIKHIKSDVSEEDQLEAYVNEQKFWDEKDRKKALEGYEKQIEEYKKYIETEECELEFEIMKESYIPTKFFDDPLNVEFLTLFTKQLIDIVE